ncbi:MAG: alpha-mannosidase [Candidatus Limnocylindrales bacterium]
MSKPAIVHLVPHTHWDREWYQPFQTFRRRLVELIDQLLATMDADPRMRFTLDGQAATVDDYLEVRPEAEPLIRRLIAERRLAIGPWQILMDEFLVSGETIVRNLEYGWARAEALGGAMRVGYLPDMFGHIAQMPQILRRAGIDSAVVWRGVPMAIDGNRFQWAAPDGSEVTAEYLVGGYGNGAHLFDAPDLLAARLEAYRTANESFYGDRSILAMYGTDHAVPTPRLADLVGEFNQDSATVEVRLETLADYIGDQEVSGQPDGRPIRRWAGELRSGARANMLMGVSSARADIKAACARAERQLARYAEPLASLYTPQWPERLLDLAWRRVVDNSAHDSICGCSHDAVGRQVLVRFAEAEQIAAGIVATAGRAIGTGVAIGSWAAVNPSPSERIDLVTLEMAAPESDPVLVSSAGRPIATQELARNARELGRLRLTGAEVPGYLHRSVHGRELFGRQVNGVHIEPDAVNPTVTLIVDDLPDPAVLDMDALIEGVTAATAPQPDASWELIVRGAARRSILAQVRVPPLGWATINPGGDGIAADPRPEGLSATTDIERVMVADRTMSNGLLRVAVDDDGSLHLEGGGTELSGAGRLVEGGEFGDSYNYGPPAADLVVETPLNVSVESTASGPLLGELVVRRRYAWPVAVLPDGSARSPEVVETEVTSRLELRAGEPFVRVTIEFDNRSRDHRVRWHVPLPSPATHTAAEGQFAVIERGLALEGGHGEVPLPTFPASGFVHAAGVTILLDQVTEYELVEGPELALTVLRSFGLISRNLNPFREDPAGPEILVPEGQRIGPVRCTFAIYPHLGGWSEAGVLEATERYQHPFITAAGSAPETTGGPDQASGLSIEGTGVVLSALRRRGESLELRLVAQSDEPTEASIRGDFREARAVDLLGRDLGPLPSNHGLIRLPMGAWEIATVRLR